MKKLLVLLGAAAFVVAAAGAGYAQESDTTDHDVYINVNEVAAINAVGTEPTFTIDIVAPGDGGEAFEVTVDVADGMWLQYSSIVAEDETRTITVEIDDVAVYLPPAGTTLSVTAADDAGNGDGILGTGSGPLDLTTDPQEIVTGIGSGYTGTAGTDGAKLTYGLAIDTVSDLFADSYTVNILYTLTVGAGII